MSQYIAIAAIRIEHNYYNPPENSFVGLEPTSETKKLMKQRGVMLRQSRGNEWQWIMADDASGFADKDVLELSMIVKDPCFLQQIESDGYDPDSFYKFNAENGLVEVNADFVWRKDTNGQKLKNEFCRIVLKPVEMVSERLRMLYMKVEQLGKEEIREENSVQFARRPGLCVHHQPGTILRTALQCAEKLLCQFGNECRRGPSARQYEFDGQCE